MKKMNVEKWSLKPSSIKTFFKFILFMIGLRVSRELFVMFLQSTDIDEKYLYAIEIFAFLILTTTCTYLFIVRKEIRDELKIVNQREIESLAYHDCLTCAYNRVGFKKELNKIIEKRSNLGKNLTILFLDLDGFKVVNDNYGHHIGDELLRIVSKRLENCLREEDIICRMGGDEFVIALKDIKNEEYVISIANKIIKNISLPYSIDNEDINISTSIGIKHQVINSLFDIEQIIKDADDAMYIAKKDGKNKYVFLK
ncbi:gp350 [Bacillus phage G]|uniref:Gp350 n=1 Tax=Bacillus phage G TaxID=2884420 RepID=G3MA91_9CAUD|nr:gp350 [Bacillus phage G]AEO93609.1 gp350 [Bacillus phage G]